MVHSIINYICLQIEDFSSLGTEVPCGRGSNNGKGRADVVISNIRRKAGLIIELKYNHSAKFALE